jgi:NAD(P)-dependent dehydrogenase (short-subunit alcohol dehydrogenase family)
MVLLFDFVDRQFIHNKPSEPTKSFKERVVVVTGANAGLGLEACRKIVELGAALVIMACRNVEKGKAAAAEICKLTKCDAKVLQVWHLDLGSHSSVFNFAERANTELPRLDALISNAGIVSPSCKIVEGYEGTITTNVISLFLHALLLYPKLRDTAIKHKTYTHLTVTASELYEVAKFKERQAGEGKIFTAFNDPKTFRLQDRYNTSKLLEILLVKQLASMKEVEGIRVIMNCVAPG